MSDFSYSLQRQSRAHHWNKLSWLTLSFYAFPKQFLIHTLRAKGAKSATMKEKIENWYSIGRKNPSDDERFYEIVVETRLNKLDDSVFEEALSDTDPDVVNQIYLRYEDLWHFMSFIYKNKKCQQ